MVLFDRYQHFYSEVINVNEVSQNQLLFQKNLRTVYVYLDAGLGPVQWKTAQYEGLVVEANEVLIVEAF